jgi:putative membrane-bound dehydrogenase-like protein
MRVLVLATLILSVGVAARLPQDGPIPPADAPGKMTVPPGFKVTLFAGEPDVVQPMAFTFDDRGRLWVVENFSYPKWLPPGQEGKDRIVIFDDPDATGHFKSRKVFLDNLPNVSAIAVGFGGVWLCSLPNLLFIPYKGGDDRPDGPAQILLDGWDMKAKHNVFSKLTWGPDGWLYACNGIMSNSRVGKPGTPDDQRIPMNCGVWRYHPLRHVFEPFAHGTTNPWGLDWDDYGQIFITNCVIKHLFHMIQGSHYERMYGEDKSAPNLYGLMSSCADHIHWAGGDWQKSRGGEAHSLAGGGHAHVGAMVYLGDNWPEAYRGHLFTLNLHGHRMSHDSFERKGSGVVAHHEKDFLMGNDPWFRGLDCQYGPDGGVFVTDWTDTGECHNYDKVDQTNGRIYKVTYGDVTPVHPNLAFAADLELVEILKHRNAWWCRHALRLLQEREAAGVLTGDARVALSRMLRSDPDVPRRLRALWGLHGTGGVNDSLTQDLLSDGEPWIRAWAIQLALENRKTSDETLAKMGELAKSDPSPVVRLFLASGLQRLPPPQRWAIAEGLVAHAEDAEDQNLPLMIWYGIEAAVSADRDRALQLVGKTKIPVVRQDITRRITGQSK